MCFRSAYHLYESGVEFAHLFVGAYRDADVLRPLRPTARTAQYDFLRFHGGVDLRRRHALHRHHEEVGNRRDIGHAEFLHLLIGELAALYSCNGAWILFDRFNVHDGPDTHCDTVVVVSAPTLDMQMNAGSLLMSTQSSFEDLWSNANDDD